MPPVVQFLMIFPLVIWLYMSPYLIGYIVRKYGIASYWATFSLSLPALYGIFAMVIWSGGCG